MNAVIAVAMRSCTEYLRDRRFTSVAAVLLVLAFVSLAVGIAEQARHGGDHASAAAADAEIWRTQGAVNPHSAAHFGMYAFRPRSPLALFDPGLTAWLGEAVWMEAHYQNPPDARPGGSAPMLQRFGELSPAWILQVLLPLLVIVAGYSALAGERERGVLRLQLLQGARGSSLVLGKMSALGIVAGLPLLVLICAGALAALFIGNNLPDSVVRWLIMAGAYLLYAGLWIALTVAVSASVQRSRNALLLLLAFWAVSTVLVPRLAANVAEAAWPATAAGEFWAEVARARAQGVDGHDPGNERTEALRAATLAQYGVDSTDDLPLDFDGIALQVDEEYGNRVFDQFYGDLAAMERGRQRVQRLFSMLSPMVALRSVSAVSSATDFTHQQHFTAAAESHRREVQRVLNVEQMLHGRGRYFANTSDDDFWRTVPLFDYSLPALAEVPGAGDSLRADFGWLAAWLVVVGLISVGVIRRLEREG